MAVTGWPVAAGVHAAAKVAAVWVEGTAARVASAATEAAGVQVVV